MNSDKRMAGNALIYILLALVLLGALTMLIAKQNSGASSEDLSAENAELLSTRMIAYAGSAKNIVDQMMFSGTPVSKLDYTQPGKSDPVTGIDYDTGPYSNKVFHPSGGGLTLDAADPVVFTDTGTTPPAGWYMGRFNNVEWTKTTAPDIMFVAFGISQQICLSIDKKILGKDATIPAISNSGNMAQYFVDHNISGVANADFNSKITPVACAECDGYPSLCVSNQAGTQWAFYNIISGQ